MVTQLPVRIEFTLPDGWTAAPPDEVGAPGVAFVALHSASANGFTANLTIAGQFREPDLTMEAIADESVLRLRANTGAVEVRRRAAVGSPDAPGMTQVLDIELGGEMGAEQGAAPARVLVQCQVYVSMQDVDDPAKRVVLELVLTCTRAQLDDVFEDFQQFVRTVKAAGPSRES